MNFILADFNWKNLLPLTFAKPVSRLLVGIDSIDTKWKRHLSGHISPLTPTYLQEAFPTKIEDQNVLINSAVLPTKDLAETIVRLTRGQVLTFRGKFLAASVTSEALKNVGDKIQQGSDFSLNTFGNEEVYFNYDLSYIQSPSDIFARNDIAIRTDFKELTKNLITTDFSKHTLTVGDEIFIARDAKVGHCVLNAENGPIYIDETAEVMEGCLIRGPFSLGSGSILKMGSKIYGATSIGKHCKVGGEVNNSVINDYSNKGHDGFLGNSVIGSWCNLGADTNTSNLKNNYGNVKIWDYVAEDFLDSGRLFQGLTMGDHSKAGINTMFNTGTVIGMCTNVFGAGFPPKFIPSFSWGNSGSEFEHYNLEKALASAAAMMARRNIEFTAEDKNAFQFAQNQDSKYKTF